MIELHNVAKYYQTRSGLKTVFREVDFVMKPGEKVGILGRNGAGKSTLIRLISGAELPSSGSVRRSMSVSWPLAFGGAFQSALTGFDNLRFICRIYGVDPSDKEEFIQDFAELGIYLREPVRTYSAGMRARLAFAISMVVEFDCFLIDEVVSVGDAKFHERCHIELFEKRRDRAMLFVSHDAGYIRDHCDRVAVIADGRLVHFDSIDEGYHWYYAQ